jgi:hypothetical protein
MAADSLDSAILLDSEDDPGGAGVTGILQQLAHENPGVGAIAVGLVPGTPSKHRGYRLPPHLSRIQVHDTSGSQCSQENQYDDLFVVTSQLARCWFCQIDLGGNVPVAGKTSDNPG